ncbi:MAG: hypothetical protein WB788_00170 [Thermoplasmata archaeon]
MATSSERMRGGYGELLRNRRWLLWEVSATAATVGYSVYAISIPWFAYQVSGSFLVVGLVLFAEVGIYSLTFLVGPLVDRAQNKRTVYIACYPAQAVAAAVLGLAIGEGFLSLPLLFGLIAFISLLWDFTWAANNVTPRLLLNPDQLFRAQGLGTLLGGATQLGGFSGGALIVVVVGPSGGLLLYAAFLAAATFLVIPLSIPSPAQPKAAYLADFREGWKYFSGKSGSALRQLASVELVRGFFSTAPTLLIVVVAARLFVGSTNAYGILFVSWVIGGIAIALFLGEWNPRRSIGWILIGSSTASGLLVAAAVWPGLALLPAATIWFLFGASGTAYTAVLYVYLRGAYPPVVIGRITANLYLFTGTAGAIGAFVLGTVAGVWSPVEFGLLFAAGLMATGALLLILPGIRRLVF